MLSLTTTMSLKNDAIRAWNKAPIDIKLSKSRERIIVLILRQAKFYLPRQPSALKQARRLLWHPRLLWRPCLFWRPSRRDPYPMCDSFLQTIHLLRYPRLLRHPIEEGSIKGAEVDEGAKVHEGYPCLLRHPCLLKQPLNLEPKRRRIGMILPSRKKYWNCPKEHKTVHKNSTYLITKQNHIYCGQKSLFYVSYCRTDILRLTEGRGSIEKNRIAMQSRQGRKLDPLSK